MCFAINSSRITPCSMSLAARSRGSGSPACKSRAASACSAVRSLIVSLHIQETPRNWGAWFRSGYGATLIIAAPKQPCVINTNVSFTYTYMLRVIHCCWLVYFRQKNSVILVLHAFPNCPLMGAKVSHQRLLAEAVCVTPDIGHALHLMFHTSQPLLLWWYLQSVQCRHSEFQSCHGLTWTHQCPLVLPLQHKAEGGLHPKSEPRPIYVNTCFCRVPIFNLS